MADVDTAQQGTAAVDDAAEGSVEKQPPPLSPASSTSSSSSETRPRLEMDTKDDVKGAAKLATPDAAGGPSLRAVLAATSSRVDRAKVCPFLLRVFAQYGAHHRLEDFTPRNLPVKQEIDIYTWKDATMRELGNLIKSGSETAASVPFVKMSFRLIFRNKSSGRFTVKDLGVVVPGRNPTRDEEKMLSDVRFEIGDYVDVAFFSGTERRPEVPGLGPGPSPGGPPRDGGVAGRDSFPDRAGPGGLGRFPQEPWDRDRWANGAGSQRDEAWGNGPRSSQSRDDGWGTPRGSWRDSDDRSSGPWRDRMGATGHPNRNSGAGPQSNNDGFNRDRRDRDEYNRSFGAANGGGGGPDRRTPFSRENKRYDPYRDNRGR